MRSKVNELRIQLSVVDHDKTLPAAASKQAMCSTLQLTRPKRSVEGPQRRPTDGRRCGATTLKRGGDLRPTGEPNNENADGSCGSDFADEDRHGVLLFSVAMFVPYMFSFYKNKIRTYSNAAICPSLSVTTRSILAANS